MNWADHIERMDRAVIASLGNDAVLYAPGVGAPVNIRGVFDEAYVRVETGQAGVESVGPAVFLRLSDLPLDPEEDEPTLTIRGKVYHPRGRERDGEGGILLMLHEVTE